MVFDDRIDAAGGNDFSSAKQKLNVENEIAVENEAIFKIQQNDQGETKKLLSTIKPTAASPPFNLK